MQSFILALMVSEELMRSVNLDYPKAKKCELKGEMKDKPQSN